MFISIVEINKFKVSSQGVNQAYIQASDLEGDVYVFPNRKSELSSNIVLDLVKPLFGRTKSGDCWINKYTSF